MKLLLTLPLLLLAACETAPTISTVTQRVEVPVAVACKATVPTAPELNFPKLQPGQDIYDKTRALLADRKLSEGYETELRTALQSCL